MSDRGRNGISQSRLAATSALAIMVLLLMGLLSVPLAQAQYTFTPLHDFRYNSALMARTRRLG